MDLVLALRDDWVWDSWVADDGENYHLFFLTAPRALLGFRNLEPDASGSRSSTRSRWRSATVS